MSALGEVLQFAGIPERIEFPGNERFVTVRLNCGGAVQRNIGTGKSPVPFTGYRIKTGQFIYSRIDARNGAFAIVGKDLDGAVVSKDFPVFTIVKDRVTPRYLDHYFRSGRLEEVIRSRSRGATNRQRIKEDEFLSFPIPLLPLDDQRRITAVLDRASRLVERSARTLQHLETAAKSLFQSRFGNPLTNSSQLPTAPLSALARIQTGNSPNRGEELNFGDSIEWIKSDNLGGSVATVAKEMLSETGRTKARIAPRGSVLVTCIAGSTKSIGKASIVDRDVAFNQQINAILPSDSLDPNFLLWQLKCAPELVRQESTGGMKALVNKTAFGAIEVLCPPLSEQQDFSRQVAEVQKLRDLVSLRSQSAESLLASLQSRAFRGEL